MKVSGGSAGGAAKWGGCGVRRRETKLLPENYDYLALDGFGDPSRPLAGLNRNTVKSPGAGDLLSEAAANIRQTPPTPSSRASYFIRVG